MSTDKTKMSNLESYQELTIQIATLNQKLDKVLEFLNQPEVEITNVINISDHPHSASIPTDEEFLETYK